MPFSRVQRYIVEADLSFDQEWTGERYVIVQGSFFDHCEMTRIQDSQGLEILSRFAPEI